MVGIKPPIGGDDMEYAATECTNMVRNEAESFLCDECWAACTPGEAVSVEDLAGHLKRYEQPPHRLQAQLDRIERIAGHEAENKKEWDEALSKIEKEQGYTESALASIIKQNKRIEAKLDRLLPKLTTSEQEIADYIDGEINKSGP